MGTITYNGPEESVRLGGKTMKKGESVEFTDETILSKSVGNPFFEVSGYEPKPVKTVTTTVDNPNVDVSKQARLEEGQETNKRPGGIGTQEPLKVEQPAEMHTTYPDSRNKADVGGSGVGPGIKVDPESFKDEPSAETQAAGKAGTERRAQREREQSQREQSQRDQREADVRARTEAAQRAASSTETTKRR